MPPEKNEKFYMLYAEGGNTPTHKHLELEQAAQEAEKLAKKTQKRVYLLEVVEHFEIKFEISKVQYPQEDLPF